MHILLVDDERALRKMASRMLQRLGATSEDIDDGKDCEKLLRSRGHIPGVPSTSGKGHRFDAILLDIVMVHSRGTDVCKHLLELGCRVPILAATANHDPWNMASYREVGFYGILPKPYSQK